MKQAWALTLLLAGAACNTAPTLELLGPGSNTADTGVNTGADTGPTDSGVPGPDTGVLPMLRADGEPCVRDNQCEHGKCMPEPAFPDGYCTRLNCSRDNQCSSARDVCVARVGPDICANVCENDSECRMGYACFAPSDGESKVCLPATQRPAEKNFDGETCRRNSDCQSNNCRPAPDWPNGHCTHLGCTSDVDCAEGEHDTACVSSQIGSFCAWSCADESDCRDGYACVAVSANGRACLPWSLVPPIGPEESYPFDLVCGLSARNGVVTIDYTIAQDTTSYTITALARDGISLAARGIELPSGASIDLTGDHLFQTVNSIYHPWLSPLTIPMVEQDEALKEAGPHRWRLDSASNDVCWYLIEENRPGTKIDLEIYLVGLENLTARTAPNDRGFQQMLGELDRIYGQVGLGVGTVHYHDVTSEVDRFRVLSAEVDFYQLMTKSVAPAGRNLDDHLVVNVFFVQTITIGALGISSAIGGPPALHGTHASGVVATAEFLNLRVPSPWTGEEVDGDILTGLIVGHEVGHYLNLWHTSDFDGTQDPVDDTPECTPDVQPDMCGAFGNLMYSAGVGTDLTPGQGYSIKAHVLSKE